MVENIEIESKGCIKFDNKVICNEQFRKMTNAVVSGITDNRKEFNQNLDNYKRNVKEGMEIAGKLSGYKNIKAKPFMKFIREKLLGGEMARGGRFQAITMLERLNEMELPISQEEKTEFLSEKEWAEARERAKE